MDHNCYQFNSSQDIINLQTKYTLFKRVENILFYVSIDGGYDRELMAKAINLLFVRHDALRIRFVKKDGKTVQYFEESRRISAFPYKVFKTWAERESFYLSFRKKKADCFKGDVLRAVFAVNPDGEQGIYFKISHFVADTYGIGVLVSDLFAVYEALKSGSGMPALPGSFEKVLAKELEYKDNAEMKARDESFFKEYYEVKHKEAPMYCGIHGNGSDEWLKVKRKGGFAMPYYFVKCDTDGMKLNIPSSVGKKAREWCEENGITLSAFFYYCFALATSIINDKATNQTPLLLIDCRGTLAERKCAGTKVQSLSVYTSVDYSRSFLENVRQSFDDQQELFRHTRLTYLEVEAIQHKLWGHSMLSAAYGFCYSFISMQLPEGVRMQVLSNGKCSLPAYIALMYDVKSDEVAVLYDVQTMLIKPAQVADFHNLYTSVIEKVINDSRSALGDIF